MDTKNTFQDVVDANIRAIVDHSQDTVMDRIYGRELFTEFKVDATDEQLQGIDSAGLGVLTMEGQKYADNELWRDYPVNVTVNKYTSELKYTEEDVYYIERQMKQDDVSKAKLKISAIANNAIPPLIGNINVDLAKFFYLSLGTTVFTGGDAVSLVNSSHPIRKTGSTQSNTATAAFASSSLSTAIDTMNRFQNMAGRQLGKCKRLRLIGGIEQEKNFQQVLLSDYGPANANLGLQTSSKSAIRGRGMDIDYIILPDIPSAYSAYWWLVDLDRASTRLFMPYAWMPRMSEDTQKDHGTFSIDSSTVFGFTCLGWQWIYGSNGTT